jgi:hypothetical protein
MRARHYVATFGRHPIQLEYLKNPMRTTSTRAQPRPILATTRLAADLDAIVESAGRQNSMWGSARVTDKGINDISEHAGVYCFTMPEFALPEERALILHGRTFGRKSTRAQLRVKYVYEARQFGDQNDLVLYVGKASRLRARIKGHLSVNVRATTNQVLRGLIGGSHTSVSKAALGAALIRMRTHARVHFFEHFHSNESTDFRTLDKAGECLVAERDLLEIKLIAKFAPPFNIKAER